VTEVLHQQFSLFIERLLNGGRSVDVVLYSGGRQSALHRALGLTAPVFPVRAFLTWLWRKAGISSWVSKGPDVSPFFACSKDSVRRASISWRWAGVYSRPTVRSTISLG
jgi:hypothetical protein